MNLKAYAYSSALLLMLPMSGCSTKSEPVSVQPIPAVRLYGVPEAMKVRKGAEIPTEDGIVVVPADTVLWSHGYVMKLLEQTSRP